MPESIENVPSFVSLDSDALERIRADLGVENLPDQEFTESMPPRKRRRGRPRKYERDEYGRVLKDKPLSPEQAAQTEYQEPKALDTLPASPLTTRDSKEIAARLETLLQGASEVGAALLNPHMKMIGKEAENIAKPLTSYVVRTEATSAVARRIINDYDIAAFVMATIAYMVRVVKDVQNERAANSERQTSEQRTPRGNPQRAPTTGRAIEPETPEVVSEVNGENASGQEGTIDLFGLKHATILQGPPGNL